VFDGHPLISLYTLRNDTNLTKLTFYQLLLPSQYSSVTLWWSPTDIICKQSKNVSLKKRRPCKSIEHKFDIWGPYCSFRQRLLSPRSTLKMQTTGSSETSIHIEQTVRRHLPENSNLHWRDRIIYKGFCVPRTPDVISHDILRVITSNYPKKQTQTKNPY
jgi:hypothetical protein